MVYIYIYILNQIFNLVLLHSLHYIYINRSKINCNLILSPPLIIFFNRHRQNPSSTAWCMIIMRKRLWSPDEDEKLQKYVTENGYGNWSDVAKKAGIKLIIPSPLIASFQADHFRRIIAAKTNWSVTRCLFVKHIDDHNSSLFPVSVDTQIQDTRNDQFSIYALK